VKVAVATTQDLFVRGGGAASHAAGLARALSSLGHEVEVVQIPFDWSSKVDVLRQAYQWRLLDLGEAADLVVTLKFPAFYVRAARKVAWILHQHRPLYDNFDLPEHSAFSSSHPEDIAIRDAVRGWDNRYLGEMRRIFTNSRTVATTCCGWAAWRRTRGRVSCSTRWRGRRVPRGPSTRDADRSWRACARRRAASASARGSISAAS